MDSRGIFNISLFLNNLNCLINKPNARIKNLFLQINKIIASLIIEKANIRYTY